MRITIQYIAGVLLVASSAHAQQAVQWKVSDGGNGHWYQRTDESMTWLLAQQNAVARGGHLATIASSEENGFVHSIGFFGLWLGGYQAPGSCEPGCGWRWVTDEPMTFTNWAPGEPNDANGGERRLQFSEWSALWNDHGDTLLMGSMTEWSADCNGDGIVDYGQCRDGSLPDYNGNNIPDCCEGNETCVVTSDPVQWRVADDGNGHWFGLGAPAASWHAAAADAASKGGHLATLRSIGETAFAASVAGGENVAYIGAVQAPGSAEPFSGWQWITGEPWGYESWHFNMDDAPCGSSAGDGEQQFLWMHNAVRQWDDVNDQDLPGCPLESKRGIVEWSADCNGDGIVDYGQCRDGSLPDYNGNNIPDCCEQGTPCEVGSYPVQWRVSEGGNGHWYQLDVAGRTWHAARSVAEATGGYLACISSAGENTIVTNLSRTPAWLGGYQDLNSPQYSEPAGAWKWVSGEPWVFTNWYLNDPNNPPEPNNTGPEHVLITWSLQVYWNDINENGTAPSLREWSADCNNDGLVDKGQIIQGQLQDVDSDGVPDICQEPSCIDADIYRDFNVNGADLGILLSQWGPNTPLTESDLNMDGAVDGLDLGILLSFWGPCP